MHQQLQSEKIEICVKTVFDEEGAHNFISIDFYDARGNSIGWALCPHVAQGIEGGIQQAFDKGLVALSDCNANHYEEYEGYFKE